MKQVLISLLAATMIFVFFQNCGEGFKSTTGNNNASSNNPTPRPEFLGPELSNFMVSLDATDLADRFYSVNSLPGDEVLLAGQTEGLSIAGAKDALIYRFDPTTGMQNYHRIDTSAESDDQFFHMESSEPDHYLATGISRSRIFAGINTNGFSNDGLFVEYNSATNAVEKVMVFGFVVNASGWQDIIRGAHKIGTDYYIVGVHGAAYPRDNSWRPFIIRMDANGQIVWARNINSDFNPRMTAVLGNSLVIFGFHQDANGTRNTGVYRVSTDGEQLWRARGPQGSFFNGTVTANNEIIAAGNIGGNGVLVRMNQDGGVITSRSIQALESDNFFGVEEMSNGDIVATAHSRSVGSRDGLDDALVLRISPNLATIQWARTYGIAGQHDRIENAHNIAENSLGQILFSGFSSPVTPDDNSNEAFAFSLNGDGTGFNNCRLMQVATVTMQPSTYSHILNSVDVVLPQNENVQVNDMTDVVVRREFVADANLLQPLCRD